jgi:hypothetical protein
MITARQNHTATLLPDGTVLVVGGQGPSAVVGTSEIYSPLTGTWHPTASSLITPRQGHTATLLASGEVLVVGGLDGAGNPLASAELYNPATGVWAPTGSLTSSRTEHTATLLPDGTVAIIGGANGNLGNLGNPGEQTPVATIEVYSPASGSFGTPIPLVAQTSVTGPLLPALHVSFLLPNGQVVIAGGEPLNPVGTNTYFSQAFPAPYGTVSLGPVLAATPTGAVGAVLADGRFLVAGGRDLTVDLARFPTGPTVSVVQIFDPNANGGAGSWALGPSLATPRIQHTLTLLPNGNVLVVGGVNIGIGDSVSGAVLAPPQIVATAEIFEPAATATATWTSLHASTGQFPCVAWPGTTNVPGCPEAPMIELANGQILIPGTAVLYDPSSNTPVSTQAAPFVGSTLTLLPDGRVLMTGGTVQATSPDAGYTPVSSNAVALFNPSTGTWTSGPNMNLPRAFHTMTLLADGRVLAAGGNGDGTTAEIFDPRANGGAGSWSFTASLAVGRSHHTATLIQGGLVLVAGGQDGSATAAIGTVELFNAALNGGLGGWTATGSLSGARSDHTATLLEDGTVLVAGGWGLGGQAGLAFNTAETYDPSTGTWTSTGPMVNAYFGRSAILLENGTVLVVSGSTPHSFLVFELAQEDSEVYDPVTRTWSATAPYPFPSMRPTLLPLSNGTVIAAGGVAYLIRNFDLFVYNPELWPVARQAVVNAPPSQLAYGTPFSLSGTGFAGQTEASSGTSANSAENYPLVKLRALEGGQITWLSPDPLTSLLPPSSTSPLTLNFSNLPASLNPGFQMARVIVGGVPSTVTPGNAFLTGVSCSVAIEAQPAGENVAIGSTAVFSIVAAGARGYQWQQDTSGTGTQWVSIPGATGPSYQTPPVSGADSGTLFRVLIQGACASAVSAPATLTVLDSGPPSANVVTPTGGEFWLLSPPSGPPSTQSVAWTATDAVRVCQVTVSLLYSNDGGVTYVPAPAGGGLPQVFGPGGSCPFPGVTTNVLTYTVPTTFPSGQAGSLYEVQVAATNQVGVTTIARSPAPFYITLPNPNIKTLIVTNSSQLGLVFGSSAASALAQKLADLSVHSRVQGRILDLASIPALSGPYAVYNAAVAQNDGSSVAAANTLLFGSGGIHDQILSTLQAFPGVSYLVVVGDDRIVPMARIADTTVLSPEPTYVAPGSTTLGSPGSISVGQALAAGTYLSDDPLAVKSPIQAGNLNIETFLPDLSVGRLVETPAQMTQAIATFIGQDGVLNLPALSTKSLVTGFDYFSDSATAIGNEWTALYGSTAVDTSLIGGTWNLGSNLAREQALQGKLCTGFGVDSFSDHATHFEIGVPSGSLNDIEGLSTSALAAPSACGAGQALTLPGSILYTIGCHAGLSVPNVAPGAPDPNNSLDLPETMLSHGAAAYVANTGYGWGTLSGPGYGKRLMELMTQQLAGGSTVPAGDAVRLSKLQYFDTASAPLDPYDLKTLQEWTLYGLPMYALNTGLGGSTSATATVAAKVSAPKAPISASTPSVQKVGGVSVVRGAARAGLTTTQTAAASALVAGTAPSPPPFLTELDLHFDFTGAGVYQKFGSAGDLRTETGCSDPNGCYYALNGLATGNTDLPVQPYFVYDSTLSGTSQHGVLWLGGTYLQESGWTPIITTLQSNGVSGSDHGSAPLGVHGKQLSISRGASQTCQATDTQVNSLTTPAGEVETTPGSPTLYNIERHYQVVNLQALYFNNTQNPTQNCDQAGPTLGTPPFGGQYHSTDGLTINWQVPVSDPIGVWRVVVVFTDNTVNAQGQGTWQPLDLAPDGSGNFVGSFTASAAGQITYVIQAVDNAGNLTWFDFTPASLGPTVTASRTLTRSASPATGGTPSSGVPLNVPQLVDVPLSGPAGPSITAVSPASGPWGTSVMISGRHFTGASAVQFNHTTASFVVSSDAQILTTVPQGATTGPITVTTPFGRAASAPFTVVSSLAVSATTVTRPPSGSVTASFVVTLMPPAAQTVTVLYATADGTAAAGTDYVAASGTLTFPAGASSENVNVTVLGNGASGPSLAFSLGLSQPTNAVIAQGTATGTILRPWNTPDFLGNGRADILWESVTGSLAAWEMGGTNRVAVSGFSPASLSSPTDKVVGYGDFNGDGRTDLLVQKASGALQVWLLRGTTQLGVLSIANSQASTWRVATVADFNGDGHPDIVWQNSSTGDLEIWLLNGTNLLSSVAIPGRGHLVKVVASGDFNGDGNPDLLFQNQSTGLLDVWFFTGTKATGTGTLSPSKLPSGFSLAAVADFNGDGRPDLLLVSGVGQLQLWLMNGTSRTGTASPSGISYPGEEPTLPGLVFDPRWQIVGPR